MPGGFPILGSITAGLSNMSGNTTSGSANVKGSWAQVIASTPHDISWVWMWSILKNANVTWSIDLGIGASGAETVVVQDMVGVSSSSLSFNAMGPYCFPLSIPAGTRLAIRSQSTTGSQSIGLNVQAFDGGFTQSQCAMIETIGFNPSTTLGTAFTCGNGSKGTYAPLIASTTQDYVGFAGFLDWHGGSPQAENLAIDIAFGPSGGERNIIPDINFRGDGNGCGWCPTGFEFFPHATPSGTRISVRGQSAIGTPTYGLTLYGVRA